MLPEVRAAVFAGDYQFAEKLCRQMQGPYNQSYQPMGDLHLEFPDATGVESYQRDLDLDRAVASVRYRVGDTIFRREVFASHPDQVIVIRLSCDRPGGITFTARLGSLLRHTTEVGGRDTLVLRGKSPAHVDPNYVSNTPHPIRYENGSDAEGMTFDLRLRAVTEGGRVTGDAKSLTVTNANSAVLLIAAGTSFNGFDKSPGRQGRNPTVMAVNHLSSAAERTWDEMLTRHLADYQSLFRRVSINLGASPVANELPTDERLRRLAQGQLDPGLSALTFQYGRYLLIASSRRGGSRQICKASGTTRCDRRGVRTGRSTSTPR